jgi:protein ImuB
MTVSQAVALLGDVPHTLTVHDSQADADALAELALRCADRLTPLVAVEPLDPYLWAGQTLHQPQSLLLDVTGIGAWFGGEQQLLLAAQQLLSEAGLYGQLAIADTAGAAWAVAHCAKNQGMWSIPSGEQHLALAPLRVAGLRIRTEQAVTLRRLGVDSIGALMRLPRSGIATRFDRELLLRLDQALGHVAETLPFEHAAPENRQAVELQYPTLDQDILGHQLSQLIRALTNHLQATRRGALRLSCCFEQERAQESDSQGGSGPLELQLGLFVPTACAEHLTRLLLGKLESCRLDSPVQRLVVTATLTGPLAVRQPTLIDLGEAMSENVTHWARLIDTLSGRLGRERVLGVTATQHPLPELATQFQPLTGQPPGALVPGRPAPTVRTVRNARSGRPTNSKAKPALAPQVAPQVVRQDPLRRPLWLYPQPLPLLVLEVAGESPATAVGKRTLADKRWEPPQHFRRGNQNYRVVRFWGPERLETGWWNGPLQRRDYFRVESDVGEWLWIYHDLRSHDWWLHGRFS